MSQSWAFQTNVTLKKKARTSSGTVFLTATPQGSDLGRAAGSWNFFFFRGRGEVETGSLLLGLYLLKLLLIRVALGGGEEGRRTESPPPIISNVAG